MGICLNTLPLQRLPRNLGLHPYIRSHGILYLLPGFFTGVALPLLGYRKQKAGKPAFPCSQISLKLHTLPRIKDQLGVKSQLDRLVKFDHAGTDEFLRVFETAVADAVLAGELSARSR